MSYQGMGFTVPVGWTSGLQQGRFLIVPPDPTPDGGVFIVISGAETLQGTMDAWLNSKMAADAVGLTVLQSPGATQGRSGALSTLSMGRTVQDPSGGVILQIYHAISDGKQAGLAVVATASESALKTLMSDVQTVFQSLRFEVGAAPPTGGDISSGQKADLTMADVAGDWGHSSASYTEYVNSSGNRTGSSTISWGAGYSLLANGTYEYTFTGMADGRYIKERDTGTWGFERGNLVIRSQTGRQPKEYYILGYQVAPDGVVFMTVLNTYYPRTEPNIEMWAERWVKKTQR
jgi:hypothetical protein